MSDKYPTEEEIKQMKLGQEAVFGALTQQGKEAWMKLVSNWIVQNKKRDHDVHFILGSLWLDSNIAIKYLQSIMNFCYRDKVSVSGFLAMSVGFECAEAKRLSKKKEDFIIYEHEHAYCETIIDKNEEQAYEVIYNKILEILSHEDYSLNFSEYPNTLYQIMINSYDEIKKQVLNTLADTSLPLDQYSLNSERILYEIDEEKSAFCNVFTNKRSLGQIKNGNAFFSYLSRDRIKVTDDNKLIFEGHTKALSLGYTQKAIILSLDRDRSLRELRQNLKFLKKYNLNESKELINYTNKLIELLEQKKYVNMIPFKFLSKEMGITKKQAKQYAKKLKHLYSIRDNTFHDNFEKIKTHNFIHKS